MTLTYGLGFQPGECFKANPADNNTWLMYEVRTQGEMLALPLDSTFATDLLAGKKVDREAAIADCKSFWPDALADSVIQPTPVIKVVESVLADPIKDLQDQLEGCRIASRSYADGVAYGNSLPSGFSDAFKEVLRCRQSLDAAIEGF